MCKKPTTLFLSYSFGEKGKKDLTEVYKFACVLIIQHTQTDGVNAIHDFTTRTNASATSQLGISSEDLNLFITMSFTSTNTNNSLHSSSLSLSFSLTYTNTSANAPRHTQTNTRLHFQCYRTDISAIASGSINPCVPWITQPWRMLSRCYSDLICVRSSEAHNILKPVYLPYRNLSFI